MNPPKPFHTWASWFTALYLGPCAKGIDDTAQMVIKSAVRDGNKMTITFIDNSTVTTD